MAKPYESPWTKAKEGKPEACHYRCGQPATLTEPGRPWKAHKVCAEGQAGGRPLGSWDETEVGPGKLEPRALGCGASSPGQTSGRACGGKGTELACQLCPDSPTYWRFDR